MIDQAEYTVFSNDKAISNGTYYERNLITERGKEIFSSTITLAFVFLGHSVGTLKVTFGVPKSHQLAEEIGKELASLILNIPKL